jgi:hypothetical protein
LNDKGNVIGVDLPTRTVRQPLVGQGALGPPAVEETDLALFRTKKACGGFDDAAVDVQVQNSGLAVLFEKPWISAIPSMPSFYCMIQTYPRRLGIGKAGMSWDSKRIFVD